MANDALPDGCVFTKGELNTKEFRHIRVPTFLIIGSRDRTAIG
jgi:hypothetical protein